MSTQQESFHVNWNVYGCVTVHAESEDAAHKIVRRTSMAKLLTIGNPDYELSVYRTDESDDGPAWSEKKLRQTAPDSLAEQLGE